MTFLFLNYILFVLLLVTCLKSWLAMLGSLIFKRLDVSRWYRCCENKIYLAPKRSVQLKLSTAWVWIWGCRKLGDGVGVEQLQSWEESLSAACLSTMEPQTNVPFPSPHSSSFISSPTPPPFFYFLFRVSSSFPIYLLYSYLHPRKLPLLIFFSFNMPADL